MISVIVPVLNESAGVADMLASLAPLRARGHEVIVVDGGSSDGTPQRCLGLADQVVTSLPGRARQMNAGAALAQGSLLLFLHADTTLPEGADQLISQALRGGTEWGRFDVRIVGKSWLLPVISALMNGRSRLTAIATGDQAMFVRRPVFDALGGFADQPLMEDIELSLRLRERSRPACLRARVRSSGRRWDSRGVWHTMALMWRLRWRYWRGTPAADLARYYR